MTSGLPGRLGLSIGAVALVNTRAEIELVHTIKNNFNTFFFIPFLLRYYIIIYVACKVKETGIYLQVIINIFMRTVAMKKKILFLLFLTGISVLYGCNTIKSTEPPLSNMDTDFKVIEKLELKLFREFENLNFGSYVFEDSILWNFREETRNFGSCYDLNTGKKLSVIVARGDAPYELENFRGACVTNEGVLVRSEENIVKVIAKKDIINNVSPEKRAVAVTTIPEDVRVARVISLPNGSLLVTIHPARFDFEEGKREDINKNSVVIFNNNEIKGYDPIKYDSFDIEAPKEMEIAINDLIKWSYAQGVVKTKGNDMAVFSLNDQFILYTLDLKSGKVLNEKRYTKILRDGVEMSLGTKNDLLLEIINMEVNDKYIYCHVIGYFSKEDKQLKLAQDAIFVFDWNLQPIKKFELPHLNSRERNGHYMMSRDCRSVYFCEKTTDELVLYKADLNM